MLENNKEKLQSILDTIKEAAREDDPEMLDEALQSIPEDFWRDLACFLPIVETFLYCINYDFGVSPTDFIPDFFWENEKSVWAYAVTLCDLYDSEIGRASCRERVLW